MTTRLAGLTGGEVNPDTKDIRFRMEREAGGTIEFVASFGVASQITAAMGAMVSQLRAQLDAVEGAVALTAVEHVSKTHIQKNRWSDEVLIQLTSQNGVPYSFAVPARVGLQIAAQLKTESSKPTEVGRA